MALTDKVQVVSVHGEKLNAHFQGVGHGLPLALSDDEGTVVLKFLSDGTRLNRHVPLSELGDYIVGQILTVEFSHD